MKTIIFGINDEDTLSAGFSRIDMSNVMGAYLSVLNIEGDNYLITKVLKSGNESNNHRIDVREIAQDIYFDGRVKNYSSTEKTQMCLKLEQLLNTDEAKEQLRSGMIVSEILKNVGINAYKATLFNIFANKDYQTQTGNVTSVDPYLFEQLKEMSKTKKSAFRVYSQMMELQNEKAQNNNPKHI